jgi:hypothetical protein
MSEVGAGGVDSLDVLGAIYPGDDRRVGRQVFDDDSAEQRGRVSAKREDHRLDIFQACLFEDLCIEHVTDKIDTWPRLGIDYECLFAAVGEQFGDFAPDFTAAGDQNRPFAAQPVRAGA